jgi:hypothetical protein
LCGDGSGGSSFAVTIAVASLCSLVSIVQKEERDNNRQRNENGGPFVKQEFEVLQLQGDLCETRKKDKGFKFHFNYKEILLVV